MRILTSTRFFLATSLMVFLVAVSAHAQQRVNPVVSVLPTEVGTPLSLNAYHASDDVELPLRYGLPVPRKPLPELRYPERAMSFRREGLVMVDFVVNEKGRVKEAQIVKGFFLDCEEEVLRVLRGARFKPVLDDQGQTVKARFLASFEFRLQPPSPKHTDSDEGKTSYDRAGGGL